MLECSDRMVVNMKGVIYYDSQYGSTRTVSEWIRLAINAEVEIIKIEENQKVDKGYDFYILGAPIFIGKPTRKFIDFVCHNKMDLQEKTVFLFITSWAQSTQYKAECAKFLELIQSYLLPCNPVNSCSLPGRLEIDKVSDRDRNALGRLLRRIDTMSEEFDSKGVVFSNQLNEVQSKKFGSEINEWIQCSGNLF